MKPEHMSPEELRRLEISRAKSDEQLLDIKDTKINKDGRMSVDTGFVEQEHSEGERNIASVELLQSREFESDFEDLKRQILQKSIIYRTVYSGMRSENRAFREFAQAVYLGKDADAHAKQLTEHVKKIAYSTFEWQQTILVIENAQSFIKKYGLRVPVLERMLPDEIIANLPAEEITTMIEQARSQVLLNAKESLGKIS